MHPYHLVIFLTLMNTLFLYDFQPGDSLEGWVVINDGVMGGRSQGSLELNSEGHGVFSGEISLENYGGFSSIRYRGKGTIAAGYTSVVLRVRGDGKRYQARIKAGQADYYSYIQFFDTQSDWQTIEIPLNSFYPSFRGRNLDLPNFKEDSLEEIGILFGNKKSESFKLEIDFIALK